MVFEQIKEIFIEEFEVDEQYINVDAVILEDLGLDSIDLYDLVMSVEDTFELELPDEALENIKTIGQLIEFIEENK